MADDVELFIFAPAQLASQKSEFFEEVYFRRHTYTVRTWGRSIWLQTWRPSYRSSLFRVHWRKQGNK